jgi:hypothetical protein
MNDNGPKSRAKEGVYANCGADIGRNVSDLAAAKEMWQLGMSCRRSTCSGLDGISHKSG